MNNISFDSYQSDNGNKQQVIEINKLYKPIVEVQHEVCNLKPIIKKESPKIIPKRMINTSMLENFMVNQFKQKECPDSSDSPFAEVIFKCKRRRLFRNEYNIKINISDFVIVEVENGIDIGTIYSCGSCASEKMKTHYKNIVPEYTIIRYATREDIEINKRNIENEQFIIEKSKDISKKYGLDMKITEAQWQFDRQRLTISFTAPQRIDFRELVKELARSFKTRIELRQISTREEAKLIGGLGSCGRSICCSSFSSDLCHVTLEHARTQQLSNNISKLSGYCGRLKCCLLFEYENYVEAFKKYPPLYSIIEYPDGNAKIVKVDIFKDIVFLQHNSSPVLKTITFDELELLFQDGKVIPPVIEEQAQKPCDFCDIIDPELLELSILEEDIIIEPIIDDNILEEIIIE
jgi:cell fate regulator YaaT (PSP1 superfamily)